MTTIATLTFDFIASSAKLNTELARANKSTTDWVKKTRQSVDIVAKSFVGIAATGAAALTAIYVNAATGADELAKFSDELAEAPERVAGLQYAAEITGSSVDGMSDALRSMSEFLGDAQLGGTAAAEAIDRLGLHTNAFYSLSPADQFIKIAEGVNQLETQQARATATAEIFGEENIRLLNLFAEGAEGINALSAEAQALGVSLNRVELAKIEAANDQLSKIGVVTSTFGKRFAAEIAPLVGAISNEFVGAAKEAGGFGVIAERATARVIDVVAFGADAVNGLKLVWQGVTATFSEYVRYVVRGLGVVATTLDDLFGELPLVGEAFKAQSEFFNEIATSVNNVADENSRTFQEALLRPPPSEGIKRWVAGVYEKAEEEAKKIADNRKGSIGQVLTSGVTPVTTPDQNEQTDFSADIARIEAQFQTREQSILAAFNRRQEIIAAAYDAEQISQEKHNELSLKNQEKYNEQIALLAEQQKETATVNYSELFSDISDATKSFAGEQSSLFKGMFAVSKAFAIAESIIKIQQGIANAASLPFPVNLAAIGTVISSTAGIISTIKGTDLPSFEGGGFTGTGPRAGGVDGRGGMYAIVHPNESIIDHNKTASSRTLGSSIVINLVNNLGVQANASVEQDGEDFTITLQRVDNYLADQVRNGKGPLNNAIQDTYKSTRRTY